jgi:hypothetical protein
MPTFALARSNPWETFTKKLCSNFKGINIAPNHPMDLFSCKQGESDPLQEYWQRFIQLRARTPNITDKEVIFVIVNGLCSRPALQGSQGN